MEYRKTVCVDFDGTIVDHEFPKVGEPKELVKEALQTFRDLGWRIIVSSCRTSRWSDEIDVALGAEGTPVMERSYVKSMIEFLDTNEIPYDEIDDGTKGKVLADLYIDDKGMRFMDNWAEIVHYVLMRKVGGKK